MAQTGCSSLFVRPSRRSASLAGGTAIVISVTFAWLLLLRWSVGLTKQSPPTGRGLLQQVFRQPEQCSGKWVQDYAVLHKSIVSNMNRPRYLVSVAVEAGMADRITGLVTQFYLALLSSRALTMVTHSDLPPFESACDMPSINWTHPQHLPDAAITPVKARYRGSRSIPEHGPVNASTYHLLFLVNDKDNPMDPDMRFLGNSNLSNYPPSNPDIPYVVSASNRGHTYKMMHNPYHRQQLASYGLTPETAFMCGWFNLCTPNAAVQQLYSRYWDVLSQPGTLRIGINVRVGDDVFVKQRRLEGGRLGRMQLAAAEPYFQCAERLERAHAMQGQKVIWYLMADSLPLRRAAASKHGQKLLTDTSTANKHPDCRQHNPESCSKLAMDFAIQHAIGQLFTFALVDFHIFTKLSGFGRLGAWMSGKHNNLFELQPGSVSLDAACNPHEPTSHEQSAVTWAQV